MFKQQLLTNLFVWDPTEPIATRPLFTTGSGNRKFFYTCDGNKNVSELVHFETRNGIAAHYDYAPFGAVTRSISASTITDNTFTTDNPFRFSSEYHDDALGLVYYNYRHYNPIDGRWCGRDPKGEAGGLNIYICIVNNISNSHDSLGLDRYVVYYSLYTICGIPIFPKFHAEIMVDLWECHNGQWYEKGIARYSFGPKGMNPFYSKGSVSSSTSYDNDTLVMTTIKSLPCEDIALINELRANQRIHPPRYYFIGSNCYDFVSKMAYFGLGCNE